MNTRMEKVAKDVALTVLRNASTTAEPPLQPEKIIEAFQARWLAPDSRRPMNEAMVTALDVVAANTPEQDLETRKTLIEAAWNNAVEEVIEEYFKAARHSFEKGEPLEGVETLTDAVRATLGRIAADRNWLAPWHPRRPVQHRRRLGKRERMARHDGGIRPSLAERL